MKKTFFNNIKIMMGLLFIAGMATSCKQLIEVPGNPPNKITEEQQFADSATTMTAVAGIYNYPAANGTSFTFNDGLLSWTTGLSSDELNTTSTDMNVESFLNYGLTGLNSTVSSLWVNPYKGLYPVNAVLGQVPLSTGLSERFKKQITAEMKVVRALYYFNLVNLFGDVPLVLSTDYRVTSILPRSSVDDVYRQILKDLTEALQALPATYPSAGRVRPNLYITEAFLAKVYLYRRDWRAAFDASDKVIKSNVYSLETDLNKVFLDGSREAIWQLPANNPSSSTTVYDAYNFVPSTGSFPTYPLTSKLLSAFEAGDLRAQQWIGSTVISGTQSYYPYKYRNISYGSSTIEDFMIFRLAEQYLIRAEARIHLGDIPGGVGDLNILRARSRPTATPTNPNPVPDLSITLSEADALTALMKERQTELFTEWGNRWFDLKRTGSATAELGGKTAWQPNALLYPVPQSEREKNRFLTQNAGYQ